VTQAVLDAIVRGAVEASGAQRGWILRLSGEELRVVAAAGERAVEAIGLTVPTDRGSVGFVVSSGQPLAIAPRPGDDQFAAGVVAALGGQTPASLLCVPCTTDDGIVGALEIVDKYPTGRFTIDDVEVVTLLGGIAGPALSDGDGMAAVPGPEELGNELRQLAMADPARYASVATAVGALLARA
jgi:GAF domain-containing protein